MKLSDLLWSSVYQFTSINSRAINQSSNHSLCLSHSLPIIKLYAPKHWSLLLGSMIGHFPWVGKTTFALLLCIVVVTVGSTQIPELHMMSPQGTKQSLYSDWVIHGKGNLNLQVGLLMFFIICLKIITHYLTIPYIRWNRTCVVVWNTI